MIDEMNTLPPDDTTPIHAHLGALSTVYVQVGVLSLRPKLKNVRYATNARKSEPEDWTLSSYFVSATKSSRKSEAMQGTWPEGSGRRGKKGQPRRGGAAAKNYPRRAGRKCKADGVSGGAS